MSPRQLLRLRESRKSDSFDDQKTAAQIAVSESTSVQQEEFLNYLLSQVKRIIFGNEPGRWFDDPASVFGSDASLYALMLATQSVFQPVACLAGDTVGSFCYIRGDRLGEKWRVTTADPFDEAKTPALGVLISKSTPTVGVLQTRGPVVGLFSGLIPGKEYHLNYPISIAPPAPGGLGYSMVQVIGHATASDILFLSGSTFRTKRRA